MLLTSDDYATNRRTNGAVKTLTSLFYSMSSFQNTAKIESYHNACFYWPITEIVSLDITRSQS